MRAQLVHSLSRRNLLLFIVLPIELADSIASSSYSRAACDFTRLSRCSDCCNSNCRHDSSSLFKFLKHYLVSLLFTFISPQELNSISLGPLLYLNYTGSTNSRSIIVENLHEQVGNVTHISHISHMSHIQANYPVEVIANSN